MRIKTRAKMIRAARKAVGLPKFERECRTIREPGRHPRKAWRVPGTPESGRHAMLVRAMQDRLDDAVEITPAKAASGGSVASCFTHDGRRMEETAYGWVVASRAERPWKWLWWVGDEPVAVSVSMEGRKSSYLPEGLKSALRR